MVRSSLFSDLCHIDNSYNDQLWFSFSSIPDVRFCGAYITPTSSPYYNPSDIANIQAKTMDRTMNYVVMGDLNARLGDSVHSIVSDHRLKYNVIDRGVNDGLNLGIIPVLVCTFVCVCLGVRVSVCLSGSMFMFLCNAFLRDTEQKHSS